MAARNSNKAHARALVRGAAHKERRFAPISQKTHSKTQPEDVLEGLSRSISLVETIAVAMQTHEDDPDLGPICACLGIACCQLRRAHGAVDLALGEVKE